MMQRDEAARRTVAAATSGAAAARGADLSQSGSGATPVTTCICSLCGSSARFLGQRKSFDIYVCQACGTMFPWPLPSESDTLRIYSQDYFAGATKGAGYVDYDRDKQPMISAFHKYLDRIEQYLPSRGLMLDVGAATGFFLDIARKRNWSVTGIEPSEHAVEVGRRKGLDMRVDIFVPGAYAPQSVDVITLWDVIEHVPDPKALLATAFETLKPGGILALNTPDSGSVLARTLKEKWHLVTPPEHLFLMNRTSLTSMLSFGFDVLETDRIGKRFTMQYVFETLYNWQKLGVWKRLHESVAGNAAGRVELPINLHDNIFVLARRRAV